MERTPTGEQQVAAVAALDQPLRLELHRMLSSAGGWVTRDDAAESLGIARSVAAFHLDKLADAGVVEVRFERLGGRNGPGAGRPSKLYRLASSEVSASVPARRYDLAGSLLATAVVESSRSGEPVAKCLAATAESTGRVGGRELRERCTQEKRSPVSRDLVIAALQSHGYEPETTSQGEIDLCNCPFHSLVEQHRDLVCNMNQNFLTGLLDGIEPASALTAKLDPRPGYCCVRIAAKDNG